MAFEPGERRHGGKSDVMGARLYFAYGSNLDENQMEQRCPTAILHGLARVNGYKFIINGRGVASLVESPEDIVEGVLWWIFPYDERALDWYEGVESGHYSGTTVQVEDLPSGETVEALVYVATDVDYGTPRLGYLEIIIRAAERHGLGADYLEELEGWQ